MIFLFTDFGVEGPYIGQVKAVLHRTAPHVPVFDLFAPVMARLAAATAPEQAGLQRAEPHRFPNWPDALAAVIYQDRYGNLMTGLQATTFARNSMLRLGRHEITWAETLSAVPTGPASCYANATGLVEIAVNGGSAAVMLAAGLGSGVEII